MKKTRGCRVFLLVTYGHRFACLKEWLMQAAHGISSSRLGTLSTGQIYDVDVTPLPKKTGNENVVGHVTKMNMRTKVVSDMCVY